MAVFTKTGEDRYDYWLLNGSKTFSTIPANTINGIDFDMPIRLQIGDSFFGTKHIIARHGKWVQQQQPNGCVATLLHKKLNTSGPIHLLDDNKIAIALRVAPDATIFLKMVDDFFSVTTMYYKRNLEIPVDNTRKIRYMGSQWVNEPITRIQR